MRRPARLKQVEHFQQQILFAVVEKSENTAHVRLPWSGVFVAAESCGSLTTHSATYWVHLEGDAKLKLRKNRMATWPVAAAASGR